MNIFRQGDVLLVETKQVIGSEVAPEKDGKLILAHGEVTGHHHRFQDENVKMFRHDDSGGGTFMKLMKEAALVHEEHSKINVPAGNYEQAFQVEYTPAELRRVAD